MSEKRAIIPNMFTMTNLVFGFIAIIFAANNRIVDAGILIFIASFFDLFDGAAARALKVNNPIGVQLDSLADAISYGIAPGIIAYQAILHNSPFGILVAPIFPICAIYRLAKFNLGAEEGSSGFSGLPSPPAGLLIATIPTLPIALPFIGELNFLGGKTLAETFNSNIEIFIIIYIFTALLMVSKVEYPKLFADIAKKGKIAAIITVITIIVFLIVFRMWSVFVLTAVYITIGLFNYIIHIPKSKSTE